MTFDINKFNEWKNTDQEALYAAKEAARHERVREYLASPEYKVYVAEKAAYQARQDAFFAEYTALCRKHGLQIKGSDQGGYLSDLALDETIEDPR